ncbi:hypothetical protein ACKWTF_006155 [Chironomus riparius]
MTKLINLFLFLTIIALALARSANYFQNNNLLKRINSRRGGLGQKIGFGQTDFVKPDCVINFIKKIVGSGIRFDQEPDLSRVIEGTMAYFEKFFKMGYVMNNAFQAKKSNKRLFGILKDDKEAEFAEDIAVIWDEFFQTMGDIFNVEASEIRKDFPELTQFVPNPQNIFPSIKRQNWKRTDCNKHSHDRSKIISKLLEIRKQKTKPISPKWETLGRKLNFLSNKDNFHDEIGI